MDAATGAKHEMGAQILNLGPGTTCPPAGDYLYVMGIDFTERRHVLFNRTVESLAVLCKSILYSCINVIC